MSENNVDTAATSQSALTHSLTTAPILKEFIAPQFKDDSLVLYFHPYNFHSQKVSIMVDHVIASYLHTERQVAGRT